MENEKSLLLLKSLVPEGELSNIKRFYFNTKRPPSASALDGLKLYVKYRGDISTDPEAGKGENEKPLKADTPRNIEGTIKDSRIFPDGMFMISLKITESEEDEDVGEEIAIYPTRDIISLYPPSVSVDDIPFEIVGGDADLDETGKSRGHEGSRRRRRKRKTKRKSRKSKKRRRKKRKTRRKRKSRRKRR